MVFFFYGPNTYASRRQLRDMMTAYKQKAGNDFGLERIDGADIKRGELVSALQAVPFLANSRLVIIEHLAANKTVAPVVGELIKLVPDSTVAVFYETEVDQRTNYFKTLNTEVKAVKFEALDQIKLAAWIRQEAKRQGASIDPAAVNRLIEIAGDDQWRLEQEIQKLANYTTDISRQTVNELVTAGFNQSVFELVDSLVAGQTQPALRIYRGLVGEGTSELYILTMIIWQLRNLVLAKASGLPANQLAQRTGLSPFVARKAAARQYDFELDQLKQAFLQAVEVEFLAKTGQADPGQLVESLIFKLSSPA